MASGPLGITYGVNVRSVGKDSAIVRNLTCPGWAALLVTAVLPVLRIRRRLRRRVIRRRPLITLALWIVVASPFLYIESGGAPYPVPDQEMTIARVLLAFAAGAAILLLLDWNRARRERRLDRMIAANVCTNCSYNLTANTSGVCPECGTPVPSKPEVIA